MASLLHGWLCVDTGGQVRENLDAQRPGTLGEAAMVQGITPAALVMLRIRALSMLREDGAKQAKAAAHKT